MSCSRWFAQPGHRYMAMSTCPEHGEFLIRVRLSGEEGDGLRVARLTYAPDSEAADAYRTRAQKAQDEEPSQHRRRRRRRPAKPRTTGE